MASKKKKPAAKKAATPKAIAPAPVLDPAKCPYIKADGFQCGGRPMSNGKCKHHGGSNEAGAPDPLAGVPTTASVAPSAPANASSNAPAYTPKKKKAGKKSSKPAAAAAKPAATVPDTPTPVRNAGRKVSYLGGKRSYQFGVDTAGPIGGNATLADHQAAVQARKSLTSADYEQIRKHQDSHTRLGSFQALGKAAGMIGDAALILQTFGRQCPGTLPNGTTANPGTYTSLQDQAKDLAECAASIKFDLDELIKHLFMTT